MAGAPNPLPAPWHPFGPRIGWIDGDRVRMLGIPFTTRMTLVQLPGDEVWVHSPVSPTPARLDAVAALGRVTHLVAPNRFHHLAVPAWQEAFPDAVTWAGPGLSSRGLPLRVDRELEDLADEERPWGPDLEHALFLGTQVLPESVFFHRPSRTLLVTDIVQNHDPAGETPFWRAVKRLNGILAPGGGVPRDWRLTVRDRAAARRSLERILAWDFDRLILSHGLCLDEGAHAHVERAFAWLS